MLIKEATFIENKDDWAIYRLAKGGELRLPLQDGVTNEPRLHVRILTGHEAGLATSELGRELLNQLLAE